MKSTHIIVAAAFTCLQYVASAPIFDNSHEVVFKGQSFTASSIRKGLKKAEVIPDVLNDFTPLFSLNITYPKSHTDVKLGNTIPPSSVSSSPDLYVDDLTETSNPILHIQALFHGSDDTTPTPTLRSNTTYTLTLTDPDATSHADPIKAEMCHWIVTGFTLQRDDSAMHVPIDFQTMASDLHFSDLESRDVLASGNGKPTELMSYYPPAPPPKTGYHRYVFVLLAPEADETTTGVREESAGLKKPKERPHWGYGKVGKGVRDWANDNGLVPVAANFFYAENKKQ
ncbi:MAG: hypothetical protein Q9168_005748 [Polycauliona sp. 1 TL-2023]